MEAHMIRNHKEERKLEGRRKRGPKKKESNRETPCATCGFKALSDISLKEHQMSEHNAIIPEQYCRFCTYISTKVGLEAHIYRNHRKERKLEGHQRQKGKGWSKVLLSCRICDFEGSERELAKHYNELHIGTKRLKCDQCEYTTNLKKQLEIHIDGTHNGKLYYCELCNFKTAWSNYLKIHTNSKHLKKSIKCSQCDFEHPWKIVINEHERTVHNGRKHKFKKKIVSLKPSIPLTTNEDIKTDVKPNPEENLCTKCGFKTKFRKYMLGHICVLPETFKCEKCKFTMKKSNRFQEHQAEGHDTKYTCNKCTFSTYTKRTYDLHDQNFHENVKLTCDNCDYTTKIYNHMRYHKRTFHIESKCEECGQIEKNKYFLRLHVQNVHVGTKISCNQCDYSDSTLYKVKKHARLTHGTKISCNQCDYSDTTLYRVEKHARITHGPNVS